MKKHSVKSFLKSLLALVLCLCMSGSALADVLTLPKSIKVIEEEAFYGDQSIDEVVLPEGIERIEGRAFADSTVSRVNLPNSLEFIAEDAFDTETEIKFSANDPSYAHDWLEDHGFSGDEPESQPESPIKDFEFTDNGDGTCTLTKYKGSDTEIVIPQKDSNGMTVTVIGTSAFFYSSITNITIQEGVTCIGNMAFANCSNLRNITIPQSVTSIGSGAFMKCTSLTNVTIPGQVTAIEDYTFYECSSLVSISIPEIVITVGNNSFYNCSALESIMIPEGVTGIGYSAFTDCSSLTSIYCVKNSYAWYWFIDAGMEDKLIQSDESGEDDPESPVENFEFIEYSDGTCAVKKYIGTESNIVIPKRNRNGKIVNSIYDNAFNNCSSPTNIKIPNSVTRIGDYAFANCSGLESITIPESVIFIGEYAFYKCNSLKSITIPENVTCIENNTFYDCNSLESVTIPSNITSIGENAFYNCYNLIGIIIPDGVTSIEDNTFFYCRSLKNITIPESVTSIGEHAFKFCNGVINIHIPSIESWLTINYEDESSHPNYDSASCHLYINSVELTDITIPEDITSIGEFAFRNCKGLENITIPGNVTNIEESAFKNCSGLTNISLPEDVISIGASAFSGCSSLTSISIPEGVRNIEDYTFSGCRNLVSIMIPESVTNIGYSAFDFCSNLTNIHIASIESWLSILFENEYSHPNYYSSPIHLFIDNIELKDILIPNSVTNIRAHAFRNCSSLENITIPTRVTSIGEEAFYNCSSLTDITIPGNGNATYIGEEAFRNCSSLTNVTILEGVMGIEKYAFASCSSLSSITIPESMKYIRNKAFEYCNNLTNIHIASIESWMSINYENIYSRPNYYSLSIHLFREDAEIASVTIPESISRIGFGAFQNCTGLTRIMVPEGVTEIGGYAFSGCSSLENIMIPESLTRIADHAFSGCSSLESIMIPDNLTDIGNYVFNESIIRYANIGSQGAKALGKAGYTFRVEGNACDLKYGYLDDDPLMVTGRDKRVTDITIPEGATDISFSAFYNDRDLRSITIPTSITSIKSGIFHNCSSLTSITIPDSIVSIEGSAFDGCTSLTNIHIASIESWVSINYSDEHSHPNYNSSSCHLFINNTELTNIIVPESLTSIGDYAFTNCSNLKSISISESVTSIGASAFRNCSSLQSIWIPESMTNIREATFAGCSSLTSIGIPENVTSIGNYAFYNCRKLTNISIPDGVTSIGHYTFAYCSSLTNIVIPVNVTSIGDRSFLGCDAVRYATIGSNGAKSLSKAGYDFRVYGNSCNLKYDYVEEEITDLLVTGTDVTLTNITIPEGVTRIGSVFQYCTNLESITIPDSVINIDNYAFYHCNNLKSITISDGVKSIGVDAFINGSNLLSIYCEINSVAWNWFINHGFENKLISWSGSFSSLPEIHQLTGSFTNRTMSILLGETFRTPAAVVKSSGDPIHRVTLTINDWNQDGTNNNRYRSRTFDGQNLYEISLTDPEWADEFSLDTTQEPLNTPGEYIINLWADTEEGGGVKPDSMTVLVATDRLSGVVTLESGEPVANVGVAVDSSAGEPSGLTYTDNNGQWKISNLNPTEQYTVYYYHSNYFIKSPVYNVRAGDLLNAIAELPGTANNQYTFTMKDTEGNELPKKNGIPYALVNTEIVFEINAPDCVKVRLIADGKVYESWNLNNGSKTITRAFNLAKDEPRKIMFQVLKENELEYSDFTGEQKLLIVAENNQKLEKVNIAQIETYALDNPLPLKIKWDPVNHATGYKVYFYQDGIRHYPYNDNSDMTYTIVPELEYKSTFTAKLYAEDRWTVEVVAIGEPGWSSSTSTSNMFSITKTDKSVKILSPQNAIDFIIGQEIEVVTGASDNLVHTKLKVIDSDGLESVYSPSFKDHFKVPLDKPGTYTLTAYIGNTEDFIITSQSIGSESVSIIVKPPEIKSVTDSSRNEYAVLYTINDEAIITCESNCKGKIQIIVDEKVKGTYTIPKDLTYRHYLRNLPEGVHTIGYKVIYGKYCSEVAEIQVISVHQISATVDDIIRYVSKETKMLLYPGKESDKEFYYGSEVKLEGFCDEYAYVTDGYYHGFVLYSDLIENLSISEDGIKIISEPDDYIVYTDGSVEIKIETTANMDNICLLVKEEDDKEGIKLSYIPIQKDPQNPLIGSVSFNTNVSTKYECYFVEWKLNKYVFIPGFEKAYFAVNRFSGTLRKKHSIKEDCNILEKVPYAGYCQNTSIDTDTDLIAYGRYKSTMYVVEYNHEKYFVEQGYVYSPESIHQLRDEMNSYKALKMIANGELTLDKRIFNPDAITHLYYLNMGTSDDWGHSALMLTDVNGNGFYSTLYNADMRSVIAIRYFGPDEMELFYSQGDAGEQMGSDGRLHSYSNTYSRWVDLMGIPECNVYRRQSYKNCLKIFKEFVDNGGSTFYHVAFYNCDDYAMVAMTGKQEIDLDIINQIFSKGGPLYISWPHETFDYLCDQAGEEYVTRIR